MAHRQHSGYRNFCQGNFRPKIHAKGYFANLSFPSLSLSISLCTLFVAVWSQQWAVNPNPTNTSKDEQMSRIFWTRTIEPWSTGRKFYSRKIYVQNFIFPKFWTKSLYEYLRLLLKLSVPTQICQYLDRAPILKILKCAKNSGCWRVPVPNSKQRRLVQWCCEDNHWRAFHLLAGTGCIFLIFCR